MPPPRGSRASTASRSGQCESATSRRSWPPFGWANFLHHRRKIDRLRVFALGVKPEYQHTGIAAAFYLAHVDSARDDRDPITWGEMGWILDTNEAMNRGMEGMGG